MPGGIAIAAAFAAFQGAAVMRIGSPPAAGRSAGVAMPALMALLALMGAGCGDRFAGGTGGGSEAGNAIVHGQVVDGKGLPVPSVRIQALPSGFDPATGGIPKGCAPGITDADG